MSRVSRRRRSPRIVNTTRTPWISEIFALLSPVFYSKPSLSFSISLSLSLAPFLSLFLALSLSFSLYFSLSLLFLELFTLCFMQCNARRRRYKSRRKHSTPPPLYEVQQHRHVLRFIGLTFCDLPYSLPSPYPRGMPRFAQHRGKGEALREMLQ